MFYFDKNSGESKEDTIYDPETDTSIKTYNDLRKTKLTLKQINELRKASDQHLLEQEAEMEFISRMYAMPTEPQ